MTQRYAVVGAGSRASFYVSAITGTYADRATLVAICEPNPVRATLYVDAVDAGVSGSLRPAGERLLLQRHWEAPRARSQIGGAAGGHGGGDALLLSDVFVGPSDDPLARPADWRDGVARSRSGSPEPSRSRPASRACRRPRHPPPPAERGGL